jgi:Flp pilus assembly protein TadG
MNPHRHHAVRLLRPRRGIATLWIILAGPAFLALLVLVTDIANLWLARVELENAVEAGALAGANVWGDGADDAANRTAAHLAAEAVAESNLVVGDPFDVDANDNPVAPNNNALVQCSGTALLGTYTAALETFDPFTSPAAVSERACRVHATATVQSLWAGFAGPFQVQASATAVYDGIAGTKLVRVTAGVCP